MKQKTNRQIFEKFLKEHPDAKNKAFNFEDAYPEIECVIEWYEEKKIGKQLSNELKGFVKYCKKREYKEGVYPMGQHLCNHLLWILEDNTKWGKINLKK